MGGPAQTSRDAGYLPQAVPVSWALPWLLMGCICPSPHSRLFHHWPPRAESIGVVRISPSQAVRPGDATEELETKKTPYHCPRDLPHTPRGI